MSGETPRDLEKLFEEFCINELMDHMIYKALARIEPDPKRKKLLERLAEQEYQHYLFWRSLLGRDCKAPRPRVSLVAVAYRLLGPAFTLRLLERGEGSAVERYRSVAERLPDELRPKLEAIVRDEEEHERLLLQEFEDVRVKYLGYVALGLADAIIEITGVHAGFLGVTASTIMAGIAGLVVGFSAAISMASAAYLQAKHGEEESPTVSAAITGLSYILSVILLALPYFLIHDMLIGFLASVAIGLALTGSLAYYSAVVQEKPFTREFAENAGLLLGTAIASYIFGQALREVFGVSALIE
ncbi:VIT1/CCC1 transporter family protein [Pyrolobus fumarii]|uniref:VIT1/CCC1 transporter family protein n=1 Tax=Pyrolobus fumarii TaxID=54252 RepID=UPI001FCB510B|nr:VIT1/CCC1 family protein [Pyrolobus fumarii]